MPPHKTIREASGCTLKFLYISVVSGGQSAIFFAVIRDETCSFAHLEKQMIAGAVEWTENVEFSGLQTLWYIPAAGVIEDVDA